MAKRNSANALSPRDENLWRAQDSVRGENGRIWATLDGCRDDLDDAQTLARQPNEKLVRVLAILKELTTGKWADDILVDANHWARNHGLPSGLAPVLCFFPGLLKNVRRALEVLESESIFENEGDIQVAVATDLANTYCREHSLVEIGKRIPLLNGIEQLAWALTKSKGLYASLQHTYAKLKEENTQAIADRNEYRGLVLKEQARAVRAEEQVKRLREMEAALERTLNGSMPEGSEPLSIVDSAAMCVQLSRENHNIRTIIQQCVEDHPCMDPGDGSGDCGLCIVCTLKAWLKKSPAELAVSPYQNCGDLLAVIHRDGGHYIKEHGFEKAIADAENVVHTLRKDLDEARTFGEEVSDILTGSKEITCVYCGYKYLDPDNNPSELTEHIETCEKHPLYQARRDASSAQGDLEKHVGEAVILKQDIRWLIQVVKSKSGLGTGGKQMFEDVCDRSGVPAK